MELRTIAKYADSASLAVTGYELDRSSAMTGHESRWYVAQTRPQHEKKVAGLLELSSIQAYLPLYNTVHRWKDRKARVSLPLFPGYVFIHISLNERVRALRFPGVVRLVSCKGKPQPLPERDLEAIRHYLSLGLPAEPYERLATGDRVRIKSGPLQGFEGTILRKQGELRVVLTLDLIMRSVVVEVSPFEVELLD